MKRKLWDSRLRKEDADQIKLICLLFAHLLVHCMDVRYLLTLPRHLETNPIGKCVKMWSPIWSPSDDNKRRKLAACQWESCFQKRPDQIGRYVCQLKNSQNVLNFPSGGQTMAIVIDDPRHGLQLIFARRADKKCTSQVKNAPFTNVDAC